MSCSIIVAWHENRDPSSIASGEHSPIPFHLQNILSYKFVRLANIWYIKYVFNATVILVKFKLEKKSQKPLLACVQSYERFYEIWSLTIGLTMRIKV